jgi:hypothetical protein
MNLSIGLDFHGVIDKHSQLFSELTKVLYAYGWEIHVITGNKINDEFLQQLKDYGISYTHTFSIVDHHESIGTYVNYDNRGPWIDADLWNRTKAEYCAANGISLHIDDSDVYGAFFTTPYLLMKKGVAPKTDSETPVDLESLVSVPESEDEVRRFYNAINGGL